VLASNLMALDSSTLKEAGVAASTTELSWLIDFLSTATLDLDDLSASDASVIFFVSGYIGRSISRRTKCAGCKELLVDNYDVPELHTCVPKEHAQLFEIADRGGLSAPTQPCFAITVQLYSSLVSNEHVKKEFLTLSNQRSAFTTAVSEVAANGLHINLLQQ